MTTTCETGTWVGTLGSLGKISAGGKFVRANIQEYRRCSVERGRVRHGTGLHRADLMDFVSQVS